MTDNEMQIAILEECGWRCCEPRPRVKDSPFARWQKGDAVRGFRNLSHHLHDLNAMREAESVLDEDQQYEFVELLGGLSCKLPSGYLWRVTHATARQRAEAFLRTVGKWRD